MCDLTNPIFTDADKAREFLEAQRWPKGEVCPHCGVIGEATEMQGKAHRPGLYQCKACREQFTVTVGTVFERSKIPLNKWMLATFLISSSKKGISSHQLHRMLGVTYKTAWFMTHRIREAMNDGGAGLLGGGGQPVEVDETYWGNVGKQADGARGYDHKMKIVSLVERDGNKRTFHVAKVNEKTLRPILNAQVSTKARLMTDEAAAYRKPGKHFAEHSTEPPRDSRRLLHLRRWSHDESIEVFPGGPGACGPDGVGARGGVRVSVGGDRIDCGQDRVHG